MVLGKFSDFNVSNAAESSITIWSLHARIADLTNAPVAGVASAFWTTTRGEWLKLSSTAFRIGWARSVISDSIYLRRVPQRTQKGVPISTGERQVGHIPVLCRGPGDLWKKLDRW